MCFCCTAFDLCRNLSTETSCSASPPQEGSHDSIIDARTALDLVLLKIKHGPSYGTPEHEGGNVVKLVDVLGERPSVTSARRPLNNPYQPKGFFLSHPSVCASSSVLLSTRPGICQGFAPLVNLGAHSPPLPSAAPPFTLLRRPPAALLPDRPQGGAGAVRHRLGSSHPGPLGRRGRDAGRNSSLSISYSGHTHRRTHTSTHAFHPYYASCAKRRPAPRTLSSGLSSVISIAFR